MKTRLLTTFTSSFLLILAGCNNDQLNRDNDLKGHKTHITVDAQVNESQTRISYEDNGQKMLFSWNPEDKLSVNVEGESENSNCELTTAHSGRSSSFSGEVTAWEGSKNIYAFYPYSPNGYTVTDGNSLATATSLLTLPNPQLYTVGDAITNGLMVGASTATSKGTDIHTLIGMKQVMSIIDLNITNIIGKITEVNITCSENVFPTSATVKLSDGTISSVGQLTNCLSMKITETTPHLSTRSIPFVIFPTDLTGKAIDIQVAFEGGLVKSIAKTGIRFERNKHYRVSFDAMGAFMTYNVNGLHWATGNLVADGSNDAKIGSPGDGGLFFQFGSLIGWGLAGSPIAMVVPKDYKYSTVWNSSWTGEAATDDAPEGKGDPCRYYLGGTWRLPTIAEFQSLFQDSNYPSSGSWIWNNSLASIIHISGMRLAATGYNLYSNGNLYNSNLIGAYWSSSKVNDNESYYFRFGSLDVRLTEKSNHANGLRVRCVRN